MLVAVAVEVKGEHVVAGVALLIAIGYIINKLRGIGHALDRWEKLPLAFEDLAEIKAEVVPERKDPNAPVLPPLHQRVAVLELAVAGIKEEMATSEQLTSHTAQDEANFDTINGKLDHLTGEHDA